MNWIIILLSLLCTTLAFAQARPSPFGQPMAAAQPEQSSEQPVSRASPLPPPGLRAPDPFGEELARALQAEQRWLTKNEALLEDFGGLPPCAEAAPQRVDAVRDAAFEAFTLRTHYYQKQVEFAATILQKAQETGSSLAVDRAELEAGTQQIAQELEAARRRKAELSASLAAAARSDDGVHVLDRLIAKLEQELKLTHDTLSEFDKSRERLRAITRWARERQRLARDQLDLVKAESRLWKAFYDGLNLRLELGCYESRPPIRQFTPRSPREVGP